MSPIQNHLGKFKEVFLILNRRKAMDYHRDYFTTSWHFRKPNLTKVLASMLMPHKSYMEGNCLDSCGVWEEATITFVIGGIQDADGWSLWWLPGTSKWSLDLTGPASLVDRQSCTRMASKRHLSPASMWIRV